MSDLHSVSEEGKKIGGVGEGDTLEILLKWEVIELTSIINLQNIHVDNNYGNSNTYTHITENYNASFYFFKNI